MTPQDVKGFRSVRGHTEAISLLRNAIHRDRVASAYLFSGPQGVGKERVALALAQALNCAAVDRDDPALDACGACSHCRHIAALSFADVFIIQRGDKDEKEDDDDDGASRRAPAKARPLSTRIEDIPEAELRAEITVGRVEWALEKMPFLPHEGGTRWVIIREADRLNVTVSNKLLKTLEEPPQRTHFVLLTHRPSALLTTVRSRCQVLRFGLLDEPDVAAVLTDLGLDHETRARVLPLADGSVGKALSFLDGDEHGRRKAYVGALLASLRDRQALIGSFNERADEAKTMDRRDLLVSLSLLHRHFRDEAVRAAADPRGGGVNAARAEVVRDAIETLSGPTAFNVQLLVQAMLVRLREVRP
jgi:DNA polymerase-3 subunit delta'